MAPLAEDAFEEALSALAADLASARQRLHALAVATLAVRHPRQLARADLNLSVGQLILASYLLGERRYLPAGSSNRFVTLLWQAVLGTRAEAGAELARGLGQAKGSFARLHLFFTRLAADITGKDDPAKGLLLLSRYGTHFVAETYRATARAMGDPEAAAEPVDFGVAAASTPLAEGFLQELERELARRKAL